MSISTTESKTNPFLNRDLMKRVDVTYNKTVSKLRTAVVRMPLAAQIQLVNDMGAKIALDSNDHNVFRAIDLIATRHAHTLINEFKKNIK